jgi:hypothetical protein
MPDAPRYDDEELLKIVGEERKRSIGFGEGDNGELQAARVKALAYAKGDMADIPSLPNRSAVVDTTVADAIETVLPDIMEVFVGGEDVATFIPQGEQDEDAAQSETDYVQYLVFEENPGFLVLYSALKDSLLTRLGVIGWWWEEDERDEPVATVPAELSDAAQQMLGEGIEAQETEDGSVALSKKSLRGKVCIKAFPSEDFTIAPDATSLRETTYCAVRCRARVQDLIARGIDAEKARELKPYTQLSGTVHQERDRAGESQAPEDDATADLRTVEYRDHYIRLADGDGDLTIYRVTTDAEERVLLDKEEVSQIPFAAFTPYIVPHRFHGESVADKLIEVQKIKTVLMRMALDSGYFALNQRMTVDETKCGEFTIADLLANEPGRPIRVKGEGAVLPVSAGVLNWDPWQALEYAATVAESRSGIVRNAQGLNPDTLHDTAKGALALITAAQKRVRMIARVFAETGVKDLFLGVHALLRSGYSGEGKTYASPSFKRGKQWQEMQPANFPQRDGMTVHVGVGSAGREHDMMVAQQRLELMNNVMQIPGVGQMVTDPGNVHNALSAWERSAGTKDANRYWSDPKGKPPPPPQPDPEMAKAQGQLQVQQAKAQADVQLAHAKAQSEAQLAAQKHQGDLEASAVQGQRDHELKMAQLQAETSLKRWQVEQELELKRESLAAELAMKREVALLQARSSHEVGMAKVEASVQQPEPGGEPG